MNAPSKPGAHGTLFRFEIAYCDDGDRHNGGTVRCWAYDAEHAEDVFYESPDADGWEVLSVRRIRTT